MLILKIFALGVILVFSYIYAQYLFTRHWEDKFDRFLDSVREQWYYQPLILTPLVVLLCAAGWLLTP